jgi:hypothetical protein
LLTVEAVASSRGNVIEVSVDNLPSPDIASLCTSTKTTSWCLQIKYTLSYHVSNLVEAREYLPLAGGTWHCLDGTKEIKFSQVNDVLDIFCGSNVRTIVIAMTGPMSQVLPRIS